MIDIKSYTDMNTDYKKKHVGPNSNPENRGSVYAWRGVSRAPLSPSFNDHLNERSFRF